MSKNATKWIICIGAMSLVVVYSCKTHYKVVEHPFALNNTPASIEHGKSLVYSSCAGCHYNRSDNKFIGNRLHELPRILGKLYSANLTNSEAYGITKHYTDAQLAYLIKTGVKKDGHFVPFMLRPNMADADVNDIIAYLRSDDAAVAAGDTSVGRTHLNFIGKMAINSKKPQPYIENISRPAGSVANGRYLVDVIGCFHCHSKGMISLNYLHPEQSKGYMQGGMKFKTPQGKKIHASNLTPCESSGIGNYTASGFRKAVKEGITPDGRKLSPPMDKYKELSDKQTDDIYAYLKTLPKTYHIVKGHKRMEIKP
ncbi:MAG: hypothetical protein JWQ38_3032 [Flavipsychrobacter sp.]|nr:hypothetical protein [Flavipsychrobacter sp.]